MQCTAPTQGVRQAQRYSSYVSLSSGVLLPRVDAYCASRAVMGGVSVRAVMLPCQAAAGHSRQCEGASPCFCLYGAHPFCFLFSAVVTAYLACIA